MSPGLQGARVHPCSQAELRWIGFGEGAHTAIFEHEIPKACDVVVVVVNVVVVVVLLLLLMMLLSV